LAFYSPLKSRNGEAARPIPVDIDGDGVVDALVTPDYLDEETVKQERRELEQLTTSIKSKLSREDADKKEDASLWGNGKWGIRILNLKPLHNSREEEDGPNGPFAPRTMFLSPLIENDASIPTQEVYPIKFLSVQIPIQRTKLGEEEKSRQRHKKMDPTAAMGGYGTNSAIPPKDEVNREYDRTRHYFCGKDWHHAAGSCHRHCPGGVSSECNDGEYVVRCGSIAVFVVSLVLCFCGQLMICLIFR
jgi:hypothetical protein